MDTATPSSNAALPTHGRVEGTWRSPGYRSARTRAKWTKALFVLTAAASAWQGIVVLQGIGLVGDALRGDFASEAEIGALERTANSADGLFLLCAIGLAVAFLAWLSRTVEITPALGAGTPHDSPRWAIGWWFIPIAFLWKPYTVVREVWDRLATPARARGGTLVLAWWLAWIASTIIARLAQATGNDPDATLDAVQGQLSILFVATAASLAAAICGFLVVREIQARADERAAALGFDAPHPIWPTAQVQPAVLGSPSTPSRTPVDRTAVTPVVAFCPKCGTRRPDDSRFCTSCGTDLSPSTPGL